MKKTIIIGLVLVVGMIDFVHAQKFMTYNLRYDNPKDGVNSWAQRKSNVVKLIAKYNPDIFGTQEGLHHQLQFLDNKLTDFSYLGVGRDDGKEKGEYCAIFYKHKKLKLIQNSTFWLSKTPKQISVGWDAVLERICTYALFEEKKSGKRFWVFNAHFDHIGKLARMQSADLIVSKIDEVNADNYPVIFMGDLNSKPDSEVIQYLTKVLRDSHDFCKVNCLLGTFNAFQHNKTVVDRIDYIFLNKTEKRISYKIIDDKTDNRFPSDHLPVLVSIKK